MASYPSSIKSFVVRVAGAIIQAAHVNDLQDEVTAIETGLVDGLTHTVKPSADNTYDLGSAALSWRDLHVERNGLVGGTLGVTGIATFAASAPIALSHASGGIKERGRTFQMGEYQTVVHSDANFTGDGTDGNWVVASGDQQVFQYTYIGKQIHVMVTVADSTVANTPAELFITVPGGAAATVGGGGAFFYDDNGTPGLGRWRVDLAGTVIKLTKISGAVWANATDNTDIQVDATFEIA